MSTQEHLAAPQADSILVWRSFQGRRLPGWGLGFGALTGALIGSIYQIVVAGLIRSSLREVFSDIGELLSATRKFYRLQL